MNVNSKERLLKVSLLMLVIFPSSLQYSQYIYVSGVYWFDLISVCLLVLLLIGTMFGFKFTVCNRLRLFFIPAFIIIIYSLFELPYEVIEVEKLKDFRPLFYILFVFLISQISRSFYFAEEYILKLVLLCFFHL